MHKVASLAGVRIVATGIGARREAPRGTAGQLNALPAIVSRPGGGDWNSGVDHGNSACV
jgi:hypothetical protein